MDSHTDQNLSETFRVIGHRGAAGLKPENTLISFQQALSMGCSMVELDVHTTADTAVHEELVVIHDERLNRTTNGRGLVAEQNLSQLQTYDAGDGESIPTLSQVMGLLKDHEVRTGQKVHLNIELKGADTAAATARFISKHRTWPILVSSFNHPLLSQFRTLDADTPVAPLFDRFDLNWQQVATDLCANAVNISKSIATPDWVKEIRQAGYEVYVYTVNSVSRAEKLRSAGASGVFTDRPDKLMKLNSL